MARQSATTATKADISSEKPANNTSENADGKKDFFWTYTEEPHRTRRMAIIKKHPEVSCCYNQSSIVSL